MFPSECSFEKTDHTKVNQTNCGHKVVTCWVAGLIPEQDVMVDRSFGLSWRVIGRSVGGVGVSSL